MRKCQLLCLPSFVAHSWLLTHDGGTLRARPSAGTSCGGTKTKQKECNSERLSDKMNGKRDALFLSSLISRLSDIRAERLATFSGFITHKSNCLGLWGLYISELHILLCLNVSRFDLFGLRCVCKTAIKRSRQSYFDTKS